MRFDIYRLSWQLNSSIALRLCMAVIAMTAMFLPARSYAQLTAGDIYTFAGNGTSGFSGDTGAATSAELYRPSGIALDSVGNVYIADYAENRIRMVNHSTGIISTVAGMGSPGYSGDGGAATSAQLYGPEAIAVDSAGNIYFTEIGNNVVRKVTSAGIISTIAGTGTLGYGGDGGAATSAYLYLPQGIAVDSNENVYIADTYNQRIRKITASTGIITTIAGTGSGGYSGDGAAATSAQLSSPLGIALDSSGNIYIADYGNSRIREITASTGNISTVAGNGTSGNTGDAGPATSAEIFAFNVTIDSVGDIVIGSGPIIRVVSTSGNINSYAGNGTVGYSGDGGPALSAEIGGGPDGIAVNSAGTIYISDANNSRVRYIYEAFGPNGPGGPGNPPTCTGGYFIQRITPSDYTNPYYYSFTVWTVPATGFSVGQYVVINSSTGYFNGTWQISSIVSSTQFKISTLMTFHQDSGGCVTLAPDE